MHTGPFLFPVKKVNWKTQRYISTTASNSDMNYAKLIVSVICAGENVEDSRTPYPFVINDKCSFR